MFTLTDLLDIAVQMEQNGQAVYCRSMEKTGDRELHELLQWMAREEEAHSRWFAERKKALPRDSLNFQTIVPDLLRDMMGEKSLSLDEVDFSRIKTKEQMLKTFIGFENDTILFYEFLDTFIDDPETCEGLKRIIQEEEAHVEKINAMLRALDDPAIENSK